VGAALGGYRVLGPAEATLLLPAAVALIAAAVIAIFFPPVIVVPFAVVCGWLGVALLIRSIQIRRGRTLRNAASFEHRLETHGVA
jgi:Flp pilus assembly protein TadB